MKLLTNFNVIISFLLVIIISKDISQDFQSEQELLSENSTPYKSINQCSNIWSRRTKDCYLLDPSTSKNVCALYHLALKVKKNGNYELEDYSKCQEIPFNKNSVQEIFNKEKQLYKSEVEILSFGLAASGYNLCSEYSYQDLGRSIEKTKNYCKQSKVNFGKNKCCYIHVNATFGTDKLEDNRCLEVENEGNAEKLAHYVVGKIESQGAINVYSDYECYTVEESKYGNN